jgi:hypothetical protein
MQSDYLKPCCTKIKKPKPRPKRVGLLKQKNMEKVMMQPSVKQTINDIALDVSWAKIAKRYFGKSPSWIYHKIDGIDGNGGNGEFTPDEKQLFVNALFDLSARIRICAENVLKH